MSILHGIPQPFDAGAALCSLPIAVVGMLVTAVTATTIHTVLSLSMSH